MKQMIATGLAALLLASLLAGCGKKEDKLSTEIVVDGVHFTVDSVEKSTMFTPKDGGSDVPYDVTLTYTVDEGADVAASREKLHSDTYFLRPDGTEDKPSITITNEEKGTCGFVIGVPRGTDTGELVMVYGEQRMALATAT